MKVLGVFLSIMSFSVAILAQEKQSLSSRLAQKGILNHMDVGVTAGSMGFGIDLAVPVTDYVRVRAGYSYMPRFTIRSNFPIETSSGGSIQEFLGKKDKINDALVQYNIDINQPEFKEYKEALDKFQNLEPKDYVTMGFKPHLHQFRFLVDILPFKNNKHWSFTTGFFVGSSNLAEACNMPEETQLLLAVNAYNSFYTDYLYNGRSFAGHGEIAPLTDIFTRNGIAGFPIGYFADGDKAMMVPSKDGTARAEMNVNPVCPYFGFGYNTDLSRDGKWKLAVDAGVMILGKPHVYVNNVYKIDTNSIDVDNECYDIIRPNEEGTDYVIDQPLPYAIDLVRDMYNMPSGKVRDMVNTISKFKVYPNLSVTVSYRLF